ncbi:multicopper oxidase domain-containing protein [Seminibacterium arietis]|uniref:Cell division protein FtsP n=1 Tax=Seminibacterium arietis TaxID=1173502 RepID=A0ABW3I7W0_9PAST
MKDYSRRQFLKDTLVLGAFSALPSTALATERQLLYIPPLVNISRGTPLFLVMDSVQQQLMHGNHTEVWGFNGHYLGPTIKIRRGMFAKLNYRNNLSQKMAINIQGLQANGELLGGIKHCLLPKTSWSPIVPINQPAATCWYHACTPAISAYQTYRGLAGMWIIEDENSRKTGLPEKYGINDIPLILQDLEVNSEGVQLFNKNQPHFFGRQLYVNGRVSPYFEVPRGWVRLRLVNASLSRIYQLKFDDDRQFQIIAQDQGFLSEAKTVQQVTLAPSERLELLVDLNKGGNATLIAGDRQNFFSKLTSFFSFSDQLVNNTVIELRPQGLLAAFDNKPRWQFNTDAVDMLKMPVARERQFHIDIDSASINNKRFDPHRIDANPNKGTVERWTLTSSSLVGFRIQGAKFIIENIDDQALTVQEIAWKDTLLFKKKAQILIKFDHTSSNNRPFFFGSSDLMLADKGCIGLIVVQ